MLDDLELMLRTIGSFVLVLFIARMLGKMITAQMSFHDFVVVITLGSIAGNLAFNLKVSKWHLIISLFTFGGFAYLLSIVALKSRGIRKWVSGKPTVLVEGGVTLDQNMKKAHVSLDTLNQELRQNGIFNIEEVEYAVLEMNGRLSILRKEPYRVTLRKDLGLLSEQPSSFPLELIMDGKIIEKNVKAGNLTMEWLEQELQKKGLRASDVFYAVRCSNGRIYWDMYKDNIRHPIDME